MTQIQPGEKDPRRRPAVKASKAIIGAHGPVRRFDGSWGHLRLEPNAATGQSASAHDGLECRSGMAACIARSASAVSVSVWMNHGHAGSHK
jgi:hypothetical protein